MQLLFNCPPGLHKHRWRSERRRRCSEGAAVGCADAGRADAFRQPQCGVAAFVGGQKQLTIEVETRRCGQMSAGMNWSTRGFRSCLLFFFSLRSTATVNHTVGELSFITEGSQTKFPLRQQFLSSVPDSFSPSDWFCSTWSQ